MKTALITLSTCCLLHTPVVAHATADGPDEYAVTRVAATDTLALRNAPSSSARLISPIPFNAVNVTNLGTRKLGWCYVAYQKRNGWAACKHLVESDGKRYYSTQGYNDFLAIRKTPSSGATMVGKIPPYETGLQGTGECNASWCPIDYQGKRGWVGRKYLASWSF